MKKRMILKRLISSLFVTGSFLEYLNANKPQRDGNFKKKLGKGEDAPPDHNIFDLFENMHQCFDTPDTPPPTPPEDIAKMYMEAKEKQDAETVKENMNKLREFNEERKRKLETSRWARFADWTNQHPMQFAIILSVFLLLLLIGVFAIFTPHSEPSPAAKKKPERQMPKMSEAEMERMRDLLKKTKGGKDFPDL